MRASWDSCFRFEQHDDENLRCKGKSVSCCFFWLSSVVSISASSVGSTASPHAAASARMVGIFRRSFLMNMFVSRLLNTLLYRKQRCPKVQNNINIARSLLLERRSTEPADFKNARERRNQHDQRQNNSRLRTESQKIHVSINTTITTKHQTSFYVLVSMGWLHSINTM